MIIKDPHFFIKKAIASLEKNILNLSKEQINEQINEIHRLAHQEFFEQARLEKLLKKIKEKTQYYYKRQYQSYNYNAFMITIAPSVALFAIICFYLFACDKNISLSVGIILITFYLLKKIHVHMRIFLNPRYKEYYEKYTFIEKKIEKRIMFIQGKYEK
jgi:hypothetical protein